MLAAGVPCDQKAEPAPLPLARRRVVPDSSPRPEPRPGSAAGSVVARRRFVVRQMKLVPDAVQDAEAHGKAHAQYPGEIPHACLRCGAAGQ
jgi:hypothetical protein